MSSRPSVVVLLRPRLLAETLARVIEARADAEVIIDLEAEDNGAQRGDRVNIAVVTDRAAVPQGIAVDVVIRLPEGEAGVAVIDSLAGAERRVPVTGAADLADLVDELLAELA